MWFDKGKTHHQSHFVKQRENLKCWSAFSLHFQGNLQIVEETASCCIYSYKKSNFSLLSTLSDKNWSDRIVEISAWCWKFCPTKNFVRRKCCPLFQYKSKAKIRQNCRNFGLKFKILSDEILSDKVSSTPETTSNMDISDIKNDENKGNSQNHRCKSLHNIFLYLH